jgi:hypothetical protein
MSWSKNLSYDERMQTLVKKIKETVQLIARRTKVPHATIWNDLDTLLSDDEVREAAKSSRVQNLIGETNEVEESTP